MKIQCLFSVSYIYSFIEKRIQSNETDKSLKLLATEYETNRSRTLMAINVWQNIVTKKTDKTFNSPRESTRAIICHYFVS